MLRILLTIAASTFSFPVWAGISDCRQQKNQSYTQAENEYRDQQLADAARSKVSGAAKPNMSKGGGNLSSGAQANVNELTTALKNNKDRRKKCDDKCDPNNTDAPNDGAHIAQRNQEQADILNTKRECHEKIDKVSDDETNDLAKNQAAIPPSDRVQDKANGKQPGDGTGGDKSSDQGKGDQKASNSPPPQIPPITPPQSQDNNKSTDTPKTDTANNDKPAATPPADTPAPAAPATGKASFQDATAKDAAKAAVCAGRASEIEGCQNFQGQSVNKTSSALPTSTATGSGGGGAGGGSGGGSGGLSAAIQSALAGQNKLGETEKDGKNSGLKAASLNMSTDGGGGGGGAGGGGRDTADFDFNFNKPGAAGLGRGPSSAMAAQSANDAKLFKMGVGHERYPVVKIVEGVYQDLCKRRRLNCGGNP